MDAHLVRLPPHEELGEVDLTATVLSTTIPWLAMPTALVHRIGPPPPPPPREGARAISVAAASAAARVRAGFCGDEGDLVHLHDGSVELLGGELLPEVQGHVSDLIPVEQPGAVLVNLQEELVDLPTMATRSGTAIM